MTDFPLIIGESDDNDRKTNQRRIMFWKKKPKPHVRTTANDQFALGTLVLHVAITKDLSSEQWTTLIDGLEKDPIDLSTPLSEADFAAVLNRAEEYGWEDWDD